MSDTAPDPVLEVIDLTVSFDTEAGRLLAVDEVSFAVPKGSTVALVGESGCGKSVTAHAIMRLLPTPPASIEGGRIRLDGRDLLALGERVHEASRAPQVVLVGALLEVAAAGEPRETGARRLHDGAVHPGEHV